MKMKTKRILAIILSASMALAMLAACTSDPVDSGTGSSGDKPIIGFSVYDMQYEFFQIMERGTRERAIQLGYDFMLHDQKSSETEMVTGAINLINSGIAALIISPCKPEALSSIVAAAKEKEIPVIVNDIGGGGADYDAIVISDCFGGGQMAADYAISLLEGREGSREVAIIKCEPEAVYAIRRGEGFKANMVAAGFNVVAEISGHSQSEQGYTIMQDLIASNPNLVAVFAENDPMAVGAANAAQDAGRGDIIIIGFNNDPEAQDAIAAGIMAGTIAQFPDEMGALTVDLANTLLTGGTLTFDNPELREIFAAVKLITPENVGVAAMEPGIPSGTIGFSVYDMQYEFFQIMEEGTRNRAIANGFDFMLHDQKSSETEMVNGAINLINSGIVALIISPCKPEALSSIVAAAKEKGIPVIVNDIGGGGADYDAIVISDNFGGGQMAADFAVGLLQGNEGSRKAAIIKCEPEAVYAIRRGEGFKANMVAAGFDIAAEISGHSQSEQGYSIMQDLLVAHPDLVVVFAENDPMAVGAANAAVDAGRDDIIIIGFNNDPEAQDAIRAGILAGTVAQFPDQMGALTVELVITLLIGGSLRFDNQELREIYAEVELITPANVG